MHLFASEDTLGALDLYSSERDPFDDQDIAVASVFAAHAAVALVTARREQQLEGKAASRDVIGMAKGIVMTRQRVSDDEAFDVLRRASQRMNVKLRELAEQVVHPPGNEAGEPPTSAERLAAGPLLLVRSGPPNRRYAAWRLTPSTSPISAQVHPRWRDGGPQYPAQTGPPH